MSFSELFPEIVTYAVLLFSPLPYGSVEEFWRFFFIFLLTFSCFWYSLSVFRKKKLFVYSSSCKVLLIILLPLFLISIFSPRPYNSFRSWLLFASLALVPVFIINYFNTVEKIKRLIFVIILAGLILCCFAIGKTFISINKIGEHLRLSFTSTYYNHNHFAGFLELVLPFALSGILFYKTRKGGKVLGYTLISILLIIAFLLTFSRGGFISFFIALFITLLLYSDRIKFFLPSLALTGFGIYIFLSLRKVLGKIFSPEQVTLSGEGRILIWKSSLLAILDKPITGWGPGNFEIAYPFYRRGINGIVNYAHNDYIEAIVECGLPIGLTLFVFVLWLIIKNIYESRKRHNPFFYYLGSASTLAIISLGFHEVVDFNLRIPANAIYFTVILSLLFLSTFCERREHNVNMWTFNARKGYVFFFLFLSGFFTIISALIALNEFIYKKAALYYKSGNLMESISLLENIERSPFKSAKYYNLHCKVLHTIGSIENSSIIFEQALEHCKNAVELDKSNSFYILDYAEILKRVGKADEAINQIKIASDRDRENIYLKAIFINTLSEAGKESEAKQIAIDFIKKYNEKTFDLLSELKDNKAILKGLISEFPDMSTEFIEKILDFLYNNNKQTEYLDVFLKVYSKNEIFSAQKYYNLCATILLKEKRNDMAVEILRTGIKLFPENPEGYLILMNHLFYTKNYEELLKLTYEAEKKINITDVYYYRSLVYLNKGEFALALKNAKLCVSRNVNNNNYRVLLYNIYMQMGMEFEALHALGDPATFTREDVYLMLQRARLFEKWGKKNEALEEYRRILSFNPDEKTAMGKIIEYETQKE